jgi:PAS domain S-box-containing protein
MAKKRDIYQSPVWLILIIIASVFVAEVLIMFFLSLFSAPSLQIWIILDAVLLTLLVSPAIYLFGFRPLIVHINERKRAEENTRHVFTELDQIFQTAADGMRIIDINYNILRMNQTLALLAGITKEEAAGKKCYEIFPGTQCHTSDCSLRQILNGNERVEIESIKERKDGLKVDCIVTVTPFRSHTGELIGIVEDFKDITARKRTEEEVKNLKKQIEFILGATKTGLDIIDSEFNIRYIDPEWQKIYGDTAGRKCYEYFMDRDEICPNCGIRKALETKTITITEETLVKEGKRPVQVTTIPFQNEKGEWLVAEVNVDISERKKLEQQLLQAQKMEAVGQLAGGIAHDFNNILTTIIGYGNLIQMEILKDNPLHTYISHILYSAQRASNLTQALLAFSRKQIISPKPVNLNEIIQILEKLLSRIIGEDIALSTSLAEEDMIVMADTTLIEQVLMNLATNARDAMPDGGSLIISTERVKMDSAFITAHGYGKTGYYALVSVEDTGQGMDRKTREKIFEPFFTTKETGKGTGLGLSIVYGIIKQHDGYINVYSEPLKGTTFKIYLPLTKTKIEYEQSAETPLLKGFSETVLLAEDDVQVRELTKQVLSEFGYKVLEAEDGQEAIRVFHENKDEIELLIFDVIMPRKNGKEAYDEIRKIKPDIRAIFTSGYTADIVHKKGILDRGLNFLPKPVSPQGLLKKVKEVLNR